MWDNFRKVNKTLDFIENVQKSFSTIVIFLNLNKHYLLSKDPVFTKYYKDVP